MVVAETDTTLAPTSYLAGSLISVGRDRSRHVVVRGGRFGEPIGPGATRCGVRGIARWPAPSGSACRFCERFESFDASVGAPVVMAPPPEISRNDASGVSERSGDLTLLFGIGPAYAPILGESGIKTWDALLERDSTEVVEILRRREMFVFPDEVERWKRHAESWRDQRPVFFGDEPCVDEPFIALDLEYVSSGGGPIWLLGACLADGDATECLQEWADDRAAEEAAARELDRAIAANPELPLVTWAGTNADLPRLGSACVGLDLPHLQRALRERHVDLFEWARRSVRFPRAGLDLKTVGGYLGVPRLSAVRDGIEANDIHAHYLRSQDPEERAALRQMLCDYNRDDLHALVGVARRLSDLAFGTGTLGCRPM